MRPPSFIPYQQGAHQSSNAFGTANSTTKGATDFLRTQDRMASILPAVTRMAALQKDCAAALPPMFEHCAVLSFENDQLVFAGPNAAIASKLKQLLPKLQENLRKSGWQVIAIRLKVQVIQRIEKQKTIKDLSLPPRAISAWKTLENELPASPQNNALKAAIRNMLSRQTN